MTRNYALITISPVNIDVPCFDCSSIDNVLINRIDTVQPTFLTNYRTLHSISPGESSANVTIYSLNNLVMVRDAQRFSYTRMLLRCQNAALVY